MESLLDANAALRYLLDDIPEQAEIVRSAILDGAGIVPEVLAECVFVLSGRIYNLPRDVVSKALKTLLDDIECENRSAMLLALDLYGTSKLDFVDCMLAARSATSGVKLLTFDKKLNKLIDDMPEMLDEGMSI